MPGRVNDKVKVDQHLVDQINGIFNGGDDGFDGDRYAVYIVQNIHGTESYAIIELIGTFPTKPSARQFADRNKHRVKPPFYLAVMRL